MDRKRQYALANEQYHQHPVLGTGPGHLYAGPTLDQASGFNLDAPTAVPAKFGLVGCAVLLWFCLQIGATARRVHRDSGPTQLSAAGRSFAFVFAAYIPLGTFFEDKGLALVLMLFFALLAAEQREAVDRRSNLDPPVLRGTPVTDRYRRQVERALAAPPIPS